MFTIYMRGPYMWRWGGVQHVEFAMKNFSKAELKWQHHPFISVRSPTREMGLHSLSIFTRNCTSWYTGRSSIECLRLTSMFVNFCGRITGPARPCDQERVRASLEFNNVRTPNMPKYRRFSVSTTINLPSSNGDLVPQHKTKDHGMTKRVVGPLWLQVLCITGHHVVN